MWCEVDWYRVMSFASYYALYRGRYLSLYDHSDQRAFQGHTAPISSMAMCPADDSFATGSDDGSVRLWHLTASKSVACLRLPSGCSSPRVAYDPTGKVFACAYQNGPASSSSSGSGSEHIIKLYDGEHEVENQS